MIAVDGSRVHCLGEAHVPIAIEGTVLWMSCIVAERLLDGVEAILGMNIVARLSGVMVKADRVVFLKDASTGARVSRSAGSPGVMTRRRTEAAAVVTTVTPMTITDQDFTAHFDGAAWVVKWTWKDGPP